MLDSDYVKHRNCVLSGNLEDQRYSKGPVDFFDSRCSTKQEGPLKRNDLSIRMSTHYQISSKSNIRKEF